MSETAALPRILFVIPGEALGNSMVFARRQAEALGRLGVPVTMFHLRSRTSPRVLWSEFRRFRSTLRGVRPDVVHAHFGTMTGFFAVLASGRIPVVITYRGSDLNFVPASRGIRAAAGRWLSQAAALRASAIVCVSRALCDRLWWRRSRVTVLPSGVDPDRFFPMPQAAARLRLGWPIEGRIILFNAGHDGRNKRLDLAQAAFDAARAVLPDLRLEVLRGDVPPASMPLILNAADCLLLTSDTEGSPNILREALACNLPVASVDAGDAAEWLAGVANARLCSRDPVDLASTVVDLTRTPRRSDGRRRMADFSSARVARELARLYEGLRAKRGGPTTSAALPWNTSLSSPPPRSSSRS